MSNRFVVHQDDHGHFHWHLRAPNGEILCHAEGFRTKEEAERSINLVKEHAVHAIVEEDLHHHHH
ncbi:MAG: YegP family protein, partial [Acetobacter sp.]|nr:YegP family protein [Acetobacter sp.]